MDWYTKDRKKSEKEDAYIITSYGMMLSVINTILLYFIESYIYIYISIIVFMYVLMIHNYVQIYVKYNDKYKTGNSYVKRKFRTIGIFIMNVYNIIMLLDYFMTVTEVNIFISTVFLIISFVTIYSLSNYLVNKLWYNFDKKRYSEIDKKNQKQKRYSNEVKIMYKKY